MKVEVLVISFILAFSCVIIKAAPQAALESTGTSSKILLNNSTNLNSQNLSSSSVTSDSRSPTTTTVDAAADDIEPATSTVDTLIINSEDTVSTFSGNLNDEETTTATGATGSEVEGLAIEPKSINGPSSSSDNSLGGESHAKIIANEESKDESVNTQPDNQSQYNPPIQTNHINMSQVDYAYVNEHKDEQETVESWDRMGKKLKKGMSNVIGSIVPFALNMSQEAKISSNCSGAMLKWVLSMNQLKSWALRMLDASGKPIAGLLEGSLTMFGNYRQCLKIRAPDDDEIEFAGGFREYFRGKYCIVQAKPYLPEKNRFYNINSKLKSLMHNTEEDEGGWYDKTVFDELSEWALAFNFVNIRMDLCIPSYCTREDIQRAVNFMLKGIDMKARVLRCEMDAPEGGFASTVVESGSREIPEALALASTDSTGNLSSFLGISPQLGWLLIPIVAILIVITATLISLVMGRKKKLNHTIKSLSLQNSMKSHLKVDYDHLADDKPLALYGIRFILILWIILVESAVNLKFEYLRELLMLKDLIFWWPMQIVINSSLQFDSIILLTAFTMSYKNTFNDSAHSARTLTRFVLDKYIRLMPSIMVAVAVVILMPLAYRGPVWNDYVPKQSAVCQSTGWINAFFLQNYLPYDQICLPQTWLLSIEFQLTLLLAPVVYYLNKCYLNRGNRSNSNYDNPDTYTNKTKKEMTNSVQHHDGPSKLFYWLKTLPGAVLIGCIVIGSASSFYDVYINDLPPSWFYTMADPDSKAIYFSQHLLKLWTHLAVFAVGIIAGVECRRATRNSLCSYRATNIHMMRHNNGFTNHKGQLASSMTSLPINLSTSQADSLASSAVKSRSAYLSGSNISIDIQANNNIGSNEQINRSESAFLNDGRSNNTSSRLFIFFDIVGFLIAFAIMGGIIFSTHDWSINDLPKPLEAALFDAASRLIWSLALIWVLYMVSVPNKNRKFSLLSRALGHPIMVCLGKLSFLIYILHPIIHTAVLAIQEQPIYSSWLMLFHILIGNMTITVILASLISLFVEMPCRNLFRRCGASLLLNQDLAGPSSTYPTSSTPNATK